MTTQHTPGPWSYQGIGPVFDVTAQAGRTAKYIGHFIARLPATIAGFEPIPEDAREANARLIAAAPDLLAAAELSLRNIESLIYGLPITAENTVQHQSLLAWAETVRAAIKKATGA